VDSQKPDKTLQIHGGLVSIFIAIDRLMTSGG